MGAVLDKSMTLAQFLIWEERQEQRYEFDGFEPVAMTGGTDAHEAIGGRLRALLLERLHGKPCRVRGPTMKIEVVGRIRYPDAFVYCKPVPSSEQIIREPVAVFEILSPITSRIDRIEKLREYQATDSIRHYVILEQDGVAATVFARAGGVWTARAVTDGDILAMPEIGIDLPLAAIYADVDLPAPDDRDDEIPAG
jgi:Uma2 family endonuclease